MTLFLLILEQFTLLRKANKKFYLSNIYGLFFEIERKNHKYQGTDQINNSE